MAPFISYDQEIRRLAHDNITLATMIWKLKYFSTPTRVCIKGDGSMCKYKVFVGCEAFLMEISNGDVKVTKLGIDAPDCKRKTLLYFACEDGDLNLVKKLIKEYNANTKVRALCGETLLHAAAENNHLDVFRYLVEEEHLDIEAVDSSKNTPLLTAARHGQLDIVKYLIEECGVNTSARNRMGEDCVGIVNRKDHTILASYLTDQMSKH